MDKNIAILMTPPGSSAIAVVRLSGAAVIEFLTTYLAKPAATGRCVHANLIDGSRVIDDVVAVLISESAVDLNLHGGTWVVRATLDLARRAGFEAVESSAALAQIKSFDVERELEREVISHLPRALTETGVRVLLAQTQAWDRLKADRIAGLNAVSEFDDLLTNRTLHYLLNPPVVAIAGVANVGKSTVANQLFARERSITADVPGTTRDWVGEIANIDGLPVMLIDTPGIRTTTDAIEQAAIEQSRREIGNADLTILVLDASRPLAGEQSVLLEQYPAAMRLVNKCDRPFAWDASDVTTLTTVATRGEGIADLRRAIVRHFTDSEEIVIDRAYVWTDRQREIIRRAKDSPAAFDEIE